MNNNGIIIRLHSAQAKGGFQFVRLYTIEDLDPLIEIDLLEKYIDFFQLLSL